MQKEHKLYAEQLSDYVLGLLTDHERASVEAHVVGCADCREIVSAERQLLFNIQSSLAATQTPSPNRLVQLMPEPPVRVRQRQMVRSWQRGLALAAVVLMLWMGNFGWQQYGGGTVEASPSPTLLAATATAAPTAVPTQIAQATAQPLFHPATPITIELTPLPSATPNP